MVGGEGKYMTRVYYYRQTIGNVRTVFIDLVLAYTPYTL